MLPSVRAEELIVVAINHRIKRRERQELAAGRVKKSNFVACPGIQTYSGIKNALQNRQLAIDFDFICFMKQKFSKAFPGGVVSNCRYYHRIGNEQQSSGFARQARAAIKAWP